MTLMQRRRALMEAREAPIKNKFVEGTYETSKTKCAVDANGDVTMTQWGAGSISIPMLRMIEIKEHDSVRLVINKISGTLNGNNVDISVCGVSIVSNGTWSNKAIGFDATVNADSNAVSTVFYAQNRTGVGTPSNYKFSVTVYLNGKKVFPGV